tara:strand:+ start:34 stop:216 length:183 start_codon:yes stop_codon:yes gene_type:complete
MKYKISWSKSGHNEIHSEILNCDSLLDLFLKIGKFQAAVNHKKQIVYYDEILNIEEVNNG